MYQKGAKGRCRDSAEGFLISLDTVGASLSHVYLPWYWADLITLGSDMTALSSSLYTHCSVDKLYTTLSHIPTVDGATSLIGRLVAAMNFEIDDFLATNDNPFASDEDKGCALGKAVQAVFKWSV